MLLALVFLGAQLHFCTDLTSAPSHFCPVCSTADSIAPTAPIQHVGLVLSRRAESAGRSRFHHLDRASVGYFSSCSARPLIFSPSSRSKNQKTVSRFEGVVS